MTSATAPRVRAQTAELGRATDAVEHARQQFRLFAYFGRRFNEKRFLRTWIGSPWLVLRPGMTLGWQLFVFVSIAKVGRATGTPFPLTLVLGFAAWNLFSESAYWCTRSHELNRRALKAIRLPGLVIVAAGVVPALVDALIGFVMFAIVAAVYVFADGQLYLHLSAASLLVLPAMLMLLMLGMAVGLFLAIPATEARDVRFGLRFVLSAWYFVTPIVYPLGAVPSVVRPLVEFNPVTGVEGLLVNGVLHTGAPSTASVLVSVIGCTVMLAAGIKVFARYERRVQEKV